MSDMEQSSESTDDPSVLAEEAEIGSSEPSNRNDSGPENEQDDSAVLPLLNDVIKEAHELSAENRRKRRRDASPTNDEESRATKIPRLFNQIRFSALETVKDLLNEDIEDITNGARYSVSHLPASQIGLTIWTSDEKEAFFNALAMYGRDNTPMIAQHVGKSVPQVRKYILLLETATEEFKETWGPPLLPDQVPAAVEIPETLESILDMTSEMMEAYAQKKEEKKEQKKFGNFWLLNREIAQLVQNQYDLEEGYKLSYPSSETDVDDANILVTIPSANILHLPNMLRLSRRFYMRKDLHRGVYRFDEHRKYSVPIHDGLYHRDPSMRRVAFDDLYNLVVSVTRRLVSATLFQAKDRVRMTGAERKTVMEKDAVNAIDVLGLSHTSFDYWVKMPRQLGLDVFVKESSRWLFEKHLVGPVTYQQAEEALKSCDGIPRRKLKYLRTTEGFTEVQADSDGDVKMESESGSEGSLGGEAVNQRILSSDDESSSTGTSSKSETSSDEESVQESESKGLQNEAQHIPDQDETEAAELEKLDQKISWEEAKKISDSIGLGQGDFQAPDLRVNFDLLKRGLDTAGPWREEILYRSTWEDNYVRKMAERE